MGLTYAPGCVEFIATLPPPPKRALRAALDLLDDDPRAHGLDWKRLETAQSSGPVYRLRVGDYRVVYVVLASETRVVGIFHRREGYRWMLRMGY